MAAVGTQIAIVVVTACIIVLATDTQLASDWMSNVASYSHAGSFDLSIESDGVQCYVGKCANNSHLATTKCVSTTLNELAEEYRDKTKSSRIYCLNHLISQS